MSNGRLVAGFAPGGGPETFNYDVPSANTREKFWEAADLIVRSWTEDGPFVHEGRYFPLRYVNLWPKPLQKPFPPVWIPGSRSPSTMTEVAKRGYCYFLSSRSHGGETHRAQQEFAAVLEKHGDRYHPFRFGILMSATSPKRTNKRGKNAQEGAYFSEKLSETHLRAGPPPTYGLACLIPRRPGELSADKALVMGKMGRA
jgi:alkanesulfonate monooxygenase SsuD/methylene tetrahydromethanopterin reductase-like flavin-dependent oxidoreductase (luciferase family)